MGAERKTLPTTTPAPHLRPLADLPALRLADDARDVRGWEVRDAGGEELGVVIDLLADPDRLVAELLIVADRTATSAGRSIVPVSRMELRGTHLVPGGGLEPFALRYQSTVRLTLWAAAVGAFVLVLAWALWFR